MPNLRTLTRAHPAISHCSHLLLKIKSGYKYKSLAKYILGGSKIIYLQKICILISFWIFQYCFYYSFTLYYCAIFYSLNTRFFNTFRVSNSLDPDQARHFVVPDLDPNCLQMLSVDDKGGCKRAKG